MVFLTNRYNLLEILSSGLIGPRAAFAKYYNDLLEVAPGRVPLFRGPLPAQVVRLVSGDDEMCFPVAIEIDAKSLASNKVPALSADGQRIEAHVGASNANVWAGGGAIPLGAWLAVHFRTQGELEEHRLREYENILENVVPLSVDASFFGDGSSISTDGTDVAAWLASLGVIDQPTSAEISAYDRLAGARCMAAHVSSPSSFSGLATFLGAGYAGPEGTSQGFPSWLDAENIVRPREKAWRGRTGEERTYASIVRVLRSTNPSATWRPLEVLRAVQEAFGQTQPTKKEVAEFDKAVAAIGAILRNDREFRPFRPGGSPLVKGLVAVLMRPEPGRLLRWLKEGSGADDEVQLVASVFVGILNGHKRLPVQFRSQVLDTFLALSTASAIGQGAGILYRTPSEDRVFAASVEPLSSSEDLVRLLWGSRILFERNRRRENLLGLLKEIDIDRPELAERLAGLCVEWGWNECVTTIITAVSGRWRPAEGPHGPNTEISVDGPVSVRRTVHLSALTARLGQLISGNDDRWAAELRSLTPTSADLSQQSHSTPSA